MITGEYYIVVKPFGIGKEYIYKCNMRLEAEWLKNQLKRLNHTVIIETTMGRGETKEIDIAEKGKGDDAWRREATEAEVAEAEFAERKEGR